jgi:hypothetical protein
MPRYSRDYCPHGHCPDGHVTLTERSGAARADTENDYPGGADIVAPPREPVNPAPWMAKEEKW